MQELVTDLEEIQRRARALTDDFEVMGYMLEFYTEIPDAEIDAMVAEVSAPIRAAIDCTKCGNCCRSLYVHVTPADLETLSAGIDIPVAEIQTRYISHEGCKEIGEWGMFNTRPCPFLKGTVCSVYAHRPETCRAYPDLSDFRWLIDNYIEGAALCPIIFNTLVAMIERVDSLYREPKG